MKKPKSVSSGEAWLQYHVQSLREWSTVSSTPAIRGWSSQTLTDFEGALKALRRSNKFSAPVSAAPLRLGARSRSGVDERSASGVYIATHAIIKETALVMASTKIGVLSPTTGEAGVVPDLVSRVTLDHESSGNTKTFPFHAQWGKKAAEFVECTVRYEHWLDEPRIPTIPLDVFLAIEIVAAQFEELSGSDELLLENEWRKDLQSSQWSNCLRRSTTTLVEPWAKALLKALAGSSNGLEVVRLITWRHMLE